MKITRASTSKGVSAIGLVALAAGVWAAEPPPPPDAPATPPPKGPEAKPTEVKKSDKPADEKKADKPAEEKKADKATEEKKSDKPADAKKSGQADSEKKEEAEETTEYNNWVEVAAGGNLVKGDKNRFEQQSRQPRDAFGGVSGFHLEEKLSKKAQMKLDGRGLFDAHDYNLKLDVTQDDLGFIRAGFKENRTWSDPTGGFLPQTGTWITPYSDAAHLDRGEAWIEGGLTLKDLPKFTFRYSHEFRDGTKDSTIWGEIRKGSETRAVVPSLETLDESRDIFQGDFTHTIGKTDLGLTLRYENDNLRDGRSTTRGPGEAAERSVTTQEETKSGIFDVHGYSQTRFSDKVLFTLGYAYNHLDTDIYGSRAYTAMDPSSYVPADLGYRGLGGGSQMNEYLAQLNLLVMPAKTLSLVPSLRLDKQNLGGFSSFTETSNGGVDANGVSSGNSDRDALSVSGRLDARYSGITNWVFYARGEWTDDQGQLDEFRNGLNPTSTGDFRYLYPMSRSTEYDHFIQKYTVGGDWYPMRLLNLGAQYYHKEQRNVNDLQSAQYPWFLPYPKLVYPGFMANQNFQTDDLNFRLTVRPLPTLTAVTRYDFQLSAIDGQGLGLSSLQTSDMTTHLISESLTWTPWARFYLQGGVTIALSEMTTPGSEVQPGLIGSSQNNYWNLNATAGYALDDKSDLQLGLLYYSAWSADSGVTVPYGANAEEYGATVTYSRSLSQRIRWNMRYGYFTYRDYTSGGNNNYEAHMIYSGLQYRF